MNSDAKFAWDLVAAIAAALVRSDGGDVRLECGSRSLRWGRYGDGREVLVECVVDHSQLGRVEAIFSDRGVGRVPRRDDLANGGHCLVAQPVDYLNVRADGRPRLPDQAVLD